MTAEQFEKFKEAEKNLFYRNLFNVLFYTGMRRGEFLALTWDDVDFKNNTINISKTLNPKLIDQSDDSPKTDKANRTILMLETVRESLLFLKGNGCDSPSSFATLTTMKRHCDSNCKKIGVDIFRIHDFRHSFVSLCIEKSIPINVISNYIGHENVSTTWDTYGHLYQDSQNKLVDILNK